MNSVIQKTKNLSFLSKTDGYTDLLRIHEGCYQVQGEECQHVCAVKVLNNTQMKLLTYSEIVKLSERLGHSLPSYHFDIHLPKKTKTVTPTSANNSDKGVLLREMLRDEC